MELVDVTVVDVLVVVDGDAVPAVTGSSWTIPSCFSRGRQVSRILTLVLNVPSARGCAQKKAAPAVEAQTSRATAAASVRMESRLTPAARLPVKYERIPTADLIAKISPQP